MIERYRLILTHYAVDTETGKHIKLDEPFCVEQVFDRRHCGRPILLNRMFDELRAYVLERAENEHYCKS